MLIKEEWLYIKATTTEGSRKKRYIIVDVLVASLSFGKLISITQNITRT